MSEDKVLGLIDFANGEIRIQATRYSVIDGDFMCCIAMVEKDDKFWELFEDMIGGDIEYSEAEDYLMSPDEQREGMFTFAYGVDPMDAYQKAKSIAENILMEREGAG